MNVGDIHWVGFPQANGREQQGRRPAIVMQDDGYAGSLPTKFRADTMSAIQINQGWLEIPGKHPGRRFILPTEAYRLNLRGLRFALRRSQCVFSLESAR